MDPSDACSVEAASRRLGGSIEQGGDDRARLLRQIASGLASRGIRSIALFGAADGALAFWSFTSDGKRSNGVRTSAPDIHPDALCFEAEMPAGVARQVYWPNELGGFDWVVESKTKKGWNRFVLHRYAAVEEE